MLNLILFLKNNKLALLLTILLISSSIFSYRFGYKVADLENKETIIAAQAKVSRQINVLEALSSQVSNIGKLDTKVSDDNMEKILLAIKNKPLAKIVDGKCKPTQDFKEAYISILKEGQTK